MIVLSRFDVPLDRAEEFRAGIDHVHALLAAKPGYLDGQIGRNLDEPTLWSLVTRWESVGSYRRALGAYDVKLEAIPLLATAIDEPSAYEVVAPGRGLGELDRRTGHDGRSIG